MNTNGGNGDSGEADFNEFVASGEVEVGVGAPGADDEAPEEKPKAPKRRAPAAKAEPVDDGAPKADGEDGDGALKADGEDGEDGEDGDENADTDAKKREGHLKRLKRERFEAKREAAELRQRLAALESGGLISRLEALEKGLPPGNSGGSKKDIGEAPDPSDTAKYPLGHLDDRYIEDKIEWAASKKLSEQSEAVLQRQQENERQADIQQQQAALLEKVDQIAARGSERFEDFQEVVVEAGMRGDWPLSQATFEAAHEAENGDQILYDLANDPKEAARVAKLSQYGQVAFVMKRDAEISTKAKPRNIPGAGSPPSTQTRGANSRVAINPATQDLDQFEKLWESDAKANG